MSTCEPDCWLCEIYNLDDGLSYTKLKLLDVSLSLRVADQIAGFCWYGPDGKLQSEHHARPITKRWLDDLITRIADSKAKR